MQIRIPDTELGFDYNVGELMALAGLSEQQFWLSLGQLVNSIDPEAPMRLNFGVYPEAARPIFAAAFYTGFASQLPPPTLAGVIAELVVHQLNACLAEEVLTREELGRTIARLARSRHKDGEPFTNPYTGTRAAWAVDRLAAIYESAADAHHVSVITVPLLARQIVEGVRNVDGMDIIAYLLDYLVNCITGDA